MATQLLGLSMNWASGLAKISIPSEPTSPMGTKTCNDAR